MNSTGGQSLSPQPDARFHFVLRFPDKCCAEVSRRGNSEPCDKPAVAVAFGTEAYDDTHWPVCRRHCRGRDLVPLEDLAAAFRLAPAL